MRRQSGARVLWRHLPHRSCVLHLGHPPQVGYILAEDSRVGAGVGGTRSSAASFWVGHPDRPSDGKRSNRRNCPGVGVLRPPLPCCAAPLTISCCSLALCTPRDRWGAAEDTIMRRTLDGVLSSLLALKLRPYIRYQGSSEACTVCGRIGVLLEMEGCEIWAQQQSPLECYCPPALPNHSCCDLPTDPPPRLPLSRPRHNTALSGWDDVLLGRRCPCTLRVC